MIWVRLLEHHWKGWLRSVVVYRTLAARVVTLSFGLVLALNLLALGCMLEGVLRALMPGMDPLESVNRLFVYYLSGDLFLRLLFQSRAGGQFRAYLTLPVNRRRLAHGALLGTLTSSFNFWPFLLTGPFLLTVIADRHTLSESTGWLVSLLAAVLLNNFAAVFFKMTYAERGGMFILLCALSLSPILMLFSGRRAAEGIAAAYFHYSMTRPVLILLPLLGAAALYLLALERARSAFHLDRSSRKSLLEKLTRLLPSGGRVGRYLSLELKMLLRNRRPRSSIYFGLSVSLFGTLAYSVIPANTSREMLVQLNQTYMGLLLTGILILVYGQFLLEWESSYFEALLSRPMELRAYLEAKLLILWSFGLVSYTACLPSLYFGHEILLRHSLLLLYNLGINAPLLLFLSGYSRRKLDLNQMFLSNQGKGALQFLVVLPTFLLPTLLMLMLHLSGRGEAGIHFLGLLGIPALCLTPFSLRLVERQIRLQKHALVEAFRKA